MLRALEVRRRHDHRKDPVHGGIPLREVRESRDGAEDLLWPPDEEGLSGQALCPRRSKGRAQITTGSLAPGAEGLAEVLRRRPLRS